MVKSWAMSFSTDDTRKPDRTRLFLMAGAVFLFWMAMYTFVATLPIYAQTRTSDLALVGTALSMYGLWQALARLPLGIAADWLGRRKPFIIAGFGLAALGAYLMGSAGGIYGILVGRAVTGLAAATWVPMVVVFSSLFPPKEAVRASSLLTLVNSSAILAASLSNGWLNTLGGYPLAFFVSIGLAGLAFLVVLPFKETRRPPQRPSLGGIGRLIMRRDVLFPALLQAVSQYAVWASTFGFLPILAKQLGASPLILPLFLTLNTAVVTAGNLASASLARRIGARRLVVASFVCMAAGLGLAWLSNSLFWVFVVQFFIGIAAGVGYPVLMGLSITHVDESERNTAMGLHQAVYGLGMFGGPWLSGILAQTMGVQPMFGVTAGVVLVLGVIGARAIRK